MVKQSLLSFSNSDNAGPLCDIFKEHYMVLEDICKNSGT